MLAQSPRNVCGSEDAAGRFPWLLTVFAGPGAQHLQRFRQGLALASLSGSCFIWTVMAPSPNGQNARSEAVGKLFSELPPEPSPIKRHSYLKSCSWSFCFCFGRHATYFYPYSYSTLPHPVIFWIMPYSIPIQFTTKPASRPNPYAHSHTHDDTNIHAHAALSFVFTAYWKSVACVLIHMGIVILMPHPYISTLLTQMRRLTFTFTLIVYQPRSII